MYGIDFQEPFIDKMVNYFFIAKILFTWWAVFETIYNKECEVVNKKLWLDMIVKKATITTSIFANLTKSWYSWGLWLKNWNSEYLNAIKKGYLNKEDIDKISEQWGWFQHNNVYSSEWLDEIYTWQRIWMSYDVLTYAVNKKVFWTHARSFKWWDTFTREVWELLKIWKIDKHYNPILDNKFSKEVMDKAWDVLLIYEYKTDDWSKRIYN